GRQSGSVPRDRGEPRSGRIRYRGCRRRRRGWWPPRIARLTLPRPLAISSHAAKLVTELLFLGLQVAVRHLRRRNLERQPLGHREAVAFEADQLARVVGEQAHRADAEVLQDLDADAVVALIGFEAEPLVGFDGVEPLLL